jgi:CBS domain containing-hemolysin-like protein
VVTIEDLAEELVGELVDENDPEPMGVVARGDDTWDVSGTLRLDEVQRATGVALPESEDYETIGGLVMARLSRLPVPGDVVTVPVEEEGGLLDEDRDDRQAVLTVLDVQRRIPGTIRLTRTRDAEPAGVGSHRRGA